jgi:hypothetical protein
MLLMKDTTSFALSLWLRRATFSDSGERLIEPLRMVQVQQLQVG